MADFRNPARAAAAGHGTSNSNAEEVLRPLVTCGICMELYVDPVALLDCLHLACGACAKEWLEQSSTCHQCRERVRGTRDSHHAAAIVEAFQSIAPNSALIQARTSDEISTMRERYRPGQGVAARAGRDRSQSPARSPRGIIPSVGALSIASPPEVNQLPPSSGDVFSEGTGRTEMWGGNCPFCNPHNGSEYVCPQPSPPPITRTEQHTIPLGHTTCAKCTRFLPVRDDLPDSKCVVCSQTSCSELGRRCQEPREGDDRFQLTRLRDVNFPEGWRLPLAHAFGYSHYERGVFETYVARQRNWNIQQLLREVLSFHGSSLRRAHWHGHPFASSSSNTVNLNDMVCLSCASDLVEGNLFEWWLAKRPDFGLPSEILSRPDCTHGIECGNVRADREHARAFNHICRSITRVDDSPHQGDMPERGNRYVANGADLDRNFPNFIPSKVIFRDKGKEPVFLCSSVGRGGSMIPGKVTLWHDSPVSVYYGASGAEHTHSGVVQILFDTRNMHWVRTTNGVIPAGCRPVLGGLSGDRQLFHSAVWWRGQRIPGYTAQGMNYAAITWNGSEWYFRDQYELLCWN